MVGSCGREWTLIRATTTTTTTPPTPQRTGQATFFHPQSSNQFVVEGFIIGGYNILCALAAILLAEFSVSGRIKVRWFGWGCWLGFVGLRWG